LATDEQLRFSSRIYIIKGATSEEFLQNASSTDRKIGELLESMEQNSKYLSVIEPIKIADILELVCKDENTGVIPTLEFINVEEIEEDVNQDKTGTAKFDFGGYAILCNSQIVDYINREEAIAYNFVKNKIQQTSIVIEANENNGDYITLGVTDSEANVDFEFSENDLKKIIINVKVQSNIDSISFKEEIFTEEQVSAIENKEAKYIEEQIKNVIKKSQDIDIDFFNFMDTLKIKHPYKYKMVVDNWKNIWSDIEIEVNVSCEVERKHDLLKMETN